MQVSNLVPFPRPSTEPQGTGQPVPTAGSVAAGMQSGTMPQMGPQAGLNELNDRTFAKDPVGDEPASDGEKVEPPDVGDLRKCYSDYVTMKGDEIDEARLALQYYHGHQYDQATLERFRSRGQPAIVFNRTGRKIDGLIGVLSKLRGDPKAVGRNAADEHGAELATQCVRTALDAHHWNAQESEALRTGLCTGIVIAEIGLTPGDKSDPDIDVMAVDPTIYFYDPRSLRHDFSDARYMGTSKLMTRDEFEELFPDQWDDAFGSLSEDSRTQFDFDKEFLWASGRTKLRLVEHWYRADGEWRYAFYAGTVLLKYGTSPFFDEKGGTVSRYVAFAVHIDEEGDHYGFVRNFKGPQDAINQHRAKALWIMNTRQIKVARAALGGDGQNIERMRTEAARADGVLVWETDPNEIEVLNNDSEFLKQTQYFQDARNELDTFGPNPSLVADKGPMDVSGRSLAMQQQAGIAELGPFMEMWNGWRLRIYRRIWVQQQRYWTAERMLRVTKDAQAAQYIAINQMRVDQWGRPVLANAIGNLDVEIILDEGPAVQNVMQDAFDVLSAMAMKGTQVPPQVLIELSGLPRSIKDKVQQVMEQNEQSPPKMAMIKAQLDHTGADTQLKLAQAQKAVADAGGSQAGAVHKLAMAHGEVHSTHQTQQSAAIEAMGAMTAAQAAQGQAGKPTAGNAGNPPQMTGGGQPAGQGVPPGGPAGPPGGIPQQGPAMPPPGPMPPLPPDQGPQLNPAAVAALSQLSGLPQGPAQNALSGPAQPAGGPPAVSRPQPGGPPVQAPDGHYYVYAPHATGPYRRVVPAGQHRPQPGGPPVLAPDGHHYVHQPHGGGNYHRVRR